MYGYFHLNFCSTNIRLALILAGDFFTGSVLAVALSKLALRFSDKSQDEAATNAFRAEVCSLLFVL